MRSRAASSVRGGASLDPGARDAASPDARSSPSGAPSGTSAARCRMVMVCLSLCGGPSRALLFAAGAREVGEHLLDIDQPLHRDVDCQCGVPDDADPRQQPPEVAPGHAAALLLSEPATIASAAPA